MATINQFQPDTIPTLRSYQLDAIKNVQLAKSAGHRRILLGSPTGSGKTVIAAALIREAAERGEHALFLAPRRELVKQASRKLADVGVDHGIILAGDPRHNAYASVQVGSVDTLRARRHKMQMLEPHLVIVDEAHLYVTEIRQKLLDQWPQALRIGLTATPCRKDGRGLRLLFDTMIEVESVAALTAQGHLVPARYFSIAEPDLHGVGMVGGDYHAGDLAKAMSPLVADVPETWLQHAGGRRTVVFAVNVAHSVALRAAFESYGISAEHVDGGTPTLEREEIFRRFSSGQTQVLCNCQIASIGFDLPELDCIVLARPTKSLAMYLQMLGRGLRTAPGKTDCLVLDHSGCVHRLGFADDQRLWTLDGHADMATTTAIREKSVGKAIECPKCRHFYTNSRTCPSCGHYIAPKGKAIRTVDGELIEIGARMPESRAEQMTFFLELRGFAAQRNFKPGWAAHKYRDKFGSYTPWHWNDPPAAAPSTTTKRWLQSQFIAAKAERELA